MIGIVRYRHILFLITRINVHNVRDFIKQNATVHTIRDAVCACTFGWNEQLTSNEQYTRSVVVGIIIASIYVCVYDSAQFVNPVRSRCTENDQTVFSLALSFSLSLSRFLFLDHSNRTEADAGKSWLRCVSYFLRQKDGKEGMISHRGSIILLYKITGLRYAARGTVISNKMYGFGSTLNLRL